MSRLDQFVEHHVMMGRHVVLGMDANANRANIERVFGGRGDRIAGEKIWLRSHRIDHVLVVPDGGALVSTGHVLAGQRSDHQPLLVRVLPR